MQHSEHVLNVVKNLRDLADSLEAMVSSFTVSASPPAVDETAIHSSDTIKTTEKQVSLEEVRAAMADKSRDGHREAVKAILTRYGVNSLSAMDPKYYVAALEEVRVLK